MKGFRNKEIPINSGNVIMSDRDSNNYEFIFSDIKPAKHLYISTFNYYMDKDYLDNILKNIANLRDIRVVFNAYDMNTVTKIVNRSIKLNPYVQLYYNENNHSKIISNGTQLYIGSANFTGFSKENYEVGVGITDKQAIKAIENQVFNIVYDYRIVISDPIQPLISYFTLIIGEYLKAMDWIEWFFDQADMGRRINDDDIDDMGIDFTSAIFNIFKNSLNKLKNFVSTNQKNFKDDGILILNYIEEISTRMNSKDDINLGYATKYRFKGFYEDYCHCLSEYKNDFWMESIIEMKHDLLGYEQNIVNNIITIQNMLIYLKYKWINDFSGNYKIKFKICDEKCIEWLIFPHYVSSALDYLV